MNCPNCGAEVVAFAVPSDLQEFAPDGRAVAICTVCLATTPVHAGESDPDFDRINDAFPEGRGGIAMALAIGLLVESLALNREAIGELLAHVQDEGADPWLVLERLEASPTIDPDVDLDRVRRQLDQLLRE